MFGVVEWWGVFFFKGFGYVINDMVYILFNVRAGISTSSFVIL
jgi:hypothetical protein